MKKSSKQVLDFNRSVFMPAFCYSGAILVVPTNERLLGAKLTFAKFLMN